MRLVVALGGNAMTAADGSARPEEQAAAIEQAVGPLADLVVTGHQLVITHGNGPQVGNLLVKNELAAAVVPPVPLDWCVAQTQATIGVLIMNGLDAALSRRGSSVRTATLVSRTVVDGAAAGFTEPAKPIGRYRPRAEAAVMMRHGQTWQDRGERGWRRVVASPEPLACLDAPAVAAMLSAGYVVVCSGGGGVPVVQLGPGRYRGVEAVIDKDLTAALLAAELDAERLIIATDVDSAMLDYGTRHQRPLRRIGRSALEALAANGAFGRGSMGPKVTAACRFVAASGGTATIASLTKLADAVAGRAGTIVLPDAATDPEIEGESIA